MDFVPECPKDIGLPFDSWREHQKETIASLLYVPEDVSILEAPTGFGKSALAISIAQITGMKTAILVRTKQLQTQYLESYEGMVTVLMGKNNYPCALVRNMKADSGPCNFGLKCNMIGECEYQRAKSKAEKAQIVILSYSYYLLEANKAGGRISSRDLQILDEGHLIERELINYSKVEFSRPWFERRGIYLPRYTETIRWRQWSRDTSEKLSAIVLDLSNQWKTSGSMAQLREAREVSRVRDDVQSLNDIDNSWVINSSNYGETFKPVWINNHFRKLMLRHARRTIIMSATVLSPQMFAKLLGISSYRFMSIPSSFAKERRQMIYDPIARMSSKYMEAELPKLVPAIERLMKHHPTQKGVIHTVNYKIRDYLMEHLQQQERLVTHGGKDREEVLESFYETSDPCVLISPSMNVGVDFRDELARWQIIAKCPFPDISDTQVKRRMDEWKEWYAYAAVADLVQTYGRVCRSPDDWGTTYLLDTNFTWLFHQNRSLFPGWVKEAIVWNKRGSKGGLK